MRRSGSLGNSKRVGVPRSCGVPKNLITDDAPDFRPMSLEGVFGSVEPSERPENFEAILAAAKDAKAEATANKLRQQ